MTGDYPLDMAHYSDIGEGDAVVAVGGIRILRYLDSEGTEHVGWRCDGDSDVERTIGMLAITQMRVFESRIQADDDA